MKHYIYLRGLRRAEHTVFCVQDGQKSYYDQQFNVRCAYSSGQQVKRSVLTAILDGLNEQQAPITFNYEISSKNEIGNKEPWSPCDPTYTDQLLGGWMKAQSGETALKRRSPFSISAMRPLHPLLGGLESQKENLTFDRSSNPNLHPVIVKDSKGKVLEEAEIDQFLSDNKRTLARRTWIPDNTRATGLFVYDIGIDLRTLFSVSTNNHEPELSPVVKEKLLDSGWVLNNNVFGECLTCPPERRKKLIPAIAEGLLNWRITSNQARTFSLMETLAVAISSDANYIASAIRGELIEEREKSARPVISRVPETELFIAPPCSGYIQGVETDIYAIEKAKTKLTELLSAFDFEKQI